MPAIQKLYVLAVIYKNFRAELLKRSDFHPRTNLGPGNVVDIGRDSDIVLPDLSRKPSRAADKRDKIRLTFRNNLTNRLRRLHIARIGWCRDIKAPIIARFLTYVCT